MDMIKTEDKELRRDLQNGMSIKKKKKKHNVTLKNAFKELQFRHNEPIILPSKTNEQHIQQNKTGNYFISKCINGKSIHLGTYNTLNDAIKIRNWFAENGWDKNMIDTACQECNVERKIPKRREK